MKPNLNDPVVQQIIGARVYLLFNQPFFGNIAPYLNLIDATSWCPTAATDGRNFYYNREFIKKLTKNELVFLIAHEVLHACYDHLGRRGSRDADIWNMATDYVINYTLVKERCGDMIKGGLYDDKYHDQLSADEVYNLLKKNSVKIQMPMDMHLDLTGGDDKDKEEGEGKTASVTVVGKDGPPKLTEEEIQSIRNQMKSAMIQAAQSAGAGRTPAGVARFIEQLIEPKLDWRQLLEMHIQSAVKEDYTFRRFSKRTWSTGCILPTQADGVKVNVCCVIDTSGSMSEEMLRDFLSEVKGIMQMFKDFDLDLFTFDTKVYEHWHFRPDNLDSIDTYPMKGGGGTMFECVWEFLKQEDMEPEKLVLFTDGYPNSTWGDPNYCDTLFVIHGTHGIVPPFGAVAYYDPKE